MSRKLFENPSQCPVVHAMNIIGNKWKPIIVYLLSSRTMRFGKLAQFIPSISRKVLTDQLRELEADGLLIRQKFAEMPPRVEYSLSEKGQNLVPVLEKLAIWSAENFPDEIVS